MGLDERPPEPQREPAPSGPIEWWVPGDQSPQPAAQPVGSVPGGRIPADEERPRLNWFSMDPQARRGRMPFDSGNASHWLASIFVWGVIAFFSLNVVAAFILVLLGQQLDTEGLNSATLIWANGALLLVGLALPPLAWVAAFYQGGAKAWAHAIFLRFSDARRVLLYSLLGVGAAVVMLILAMVVTMLLQLVGYEPENPVVEGMAQILTWPLVFWIAITAAIGEELFFRGFLQPRIGIVASAVAFGLLHMSYGVPLQVFIPLLFGFLLSFLVVYTRSLVPAMAAHFCYNFGVGAVLILTRDTGLV